MNFRDRFCRTLRVLAIPVLAAFLLVSVATPAAAETVIRNATGTGQSAAYQIGGLAKAYVQVESATTSSATVLVQQRMGPSSSWQTVKTITDPAAGAVAYYLEPLGEVRVSVTVHSSGTIKATLAGYTVTGTEATW